ncbi:hypothetical protein FHL15_000839 [Xylaria flabelliformis]|uniref:DUF7905 domain-containing protein n=1 Tax=Xylaria flabelliformis TaxID=2512241 RepID=A0A553IDB5_9PEZI|nr:hypothetical protein FHL15_000839 [Xylaria flabelliformis]
MSTHKSGSNESAQHGIPASLRAQMSPMAVIQQNARRAKKEGTVTTHQAHGIATFIVPGEPNAIKGVINAVYHDLKDGNKDANIEFRETAVPYIRVHAPTEEDAMALVRTAQRLAVEHLSGDSTETRVVFVEPPTNYMTTDFQIDVHVVDNIKCARPTLESIPGTSNMLLKSFSDRYKRELSEKLYEAFERASSHHASLSLKIHLGHYLLQTYRKGKCTLEQFESMVNSPRATGKLDTRLGKAPFAEGLSVEAAMRLIQAVDSPCIPLDNQTATSADVSPIYVLESWHDGNRYEAELDINKTKYDPVNGPLKFNLARTKTIPQSAQVPRFEATSISIGRKLDWKIVATPRDEKVGVPSTVKKYLEMGQAVMQGSSINFRCYPTIRLPKSNALANKLKPVATKSIYRFGWRRTGYVLQFTINRRWQCIREMENQAPMETDFDVTIYADNWDQDSQVQAGETVGKIWGADLQGLLQDEVGDGLSRVQGLIKTILDIRDFLEGYSLEQ